MADNYTTLGSTSEIQVLSASETLPVEMVQIRTRPTGCRLQYPVPAIVWDADQGGPLLSTLAGNVENFVAQGLASTAYSGQDLDASGLLVDRVTFVVSYTPAGGTRGTFETTVTVDTELLVASGDPFTFGLLADVEKQLEDALNNLKATAAL